MTLVVAFIFFMHKEFPPKTLTVTIGVAEKDFKKLVSPFLSELYPLYPLPLTVLHIVCKFEKIPKQIWKPFENFAQYLVVVDDLSLESSIKPVKF